MQGHARINCSGASMTKVPSSRFSVRIAGTIAMLALSFLLVSLDPFLHAALIARPSIDTGASPLSVNRLRKGNKLPAANSDVSSPTGGKPAIWQDRFLVPGHPDIREKMPVGCDPAFSQVSPSAANVYGRCLV